MNIKDICDEWLNAVENSVRSAEGDNHWTIDYVIDLCLDEKHEELWEVIKYLYPKQMKRRTFANLAAGPMKELLSIAGSRYIDEIEALANKDNRFGKLLGGVWRSDIEESVWVRVKTVRDTAW